MPIFFDKVTAEEKGREFVRLIDQDVQDRRKAIKMREYIRNVYYGLMRRKLRYKGQTNIHLHVMAEKIETLVSKEMNAFWAVEPHAHAQRVAEEFDQEETRAVEHMTNWAMDIDIPNFYRTFESWLRNRHLDGVAAVKCSYVHQERNGIVIEKAATMWLPDEIDISQQKVPEKRMKVPLEILASKFARLNIQSAKLGKKDIDPVAEQPLEGLSFVIDFIEGEIEHFNITVTFAPNKFVDSIDIIVFRPLIEKDNVEAELIEFEDLIVPYRAKDLQSPGHIAQKYYLTLHEIQRLRDSGDWILTDSDMEKLESKASAARDDETMMKTSDRSLARQKDQMTGHQTTQSRTTKDRLKPYLADKILVLEVYARDNLEDSNLPTEMIYQIPYALEKIVSAEYLEEPYPHGRRPFSDLYSIAISNRYYSWSVGQLLAPINVEVNTIVNSVNDAQELINNPFFFYIPSAMPGDPKAMRGIVPGQGIPIGEPNGVIFPKFQQEPLANLTTMDSLLLFADRLTVSPQSSGSSQVRNSPRTARGTLALLSEAGAKVDSFISAAQKGGWSELIYQIYALYDAFATDEKWTKVTGIKRRPKKKTGDLRGRVTFRFKGNTVNTNKEVMRSIAQQRFAILANDPAYLADPQARRALIEDFLRHFSEGTDVDKLLPRMAGNGLREAMDQKSEIEIMLQGMPVDVLPEDNHAQHIGIMQQFKGNKRFDELEQSSVAMLAWHTKQHQNMLIQQQQQGQMQGGSVANNVPQQMGDLEGGVV